MSVRIDPETLVYAIVTSKKHLSPGSLTRDQHFRDDLEITSIEALEILMSVEDEFSIEIPDEDSERLFTVGDLIDDVNQRVQALR